MGSSLFFQPRLEALEELIAPSASYAATVLADSPILYWRLGESSGTTAADASPNGNNGTYSATGVTYSQTGPIVGDANTAVLLNPGVPGTILSPNLTSFFPAGPNRETVTLSIWFNSPSGGGVLVNENDISTGWQDTQIEVQTNGQVLIRVWSSPAVSLGTATFNAWHHAVLRYNKATLTLDGFLDGVLSPTPVTMYDRLAPYEFGSNQFYHVGRPGGTALGNGVAFNGRVDEFSVFNTALSNAQVQELYQRGIGLFSDVSISKTDGVTELTPGDTVNYQIVVSNAGPDGVTDAAVVDLLPPILTEVIYTANQLGGATGFTASGSGSINDLVNLPANSSITYDITATLPFNANGTLSNAATVTPPLGITDLTADDDSATDDDTILPLPAPVFLAPDPGDNSKTALIVVGSGLDDTILVKKVSAGYRVLIGGVSQGNFAPSGSILIFGFAGNDSITVDKFVTAGALLDGGDGDDKLIGGKGHDILIGGDGRDVLKGRRGRNIVIGGGTVPTIHLVDLCVARQEWGAGQVPAGLTFTELVDDGIVDALYVSLERDLIFTDPTL